MAFSFDQFIYDILQIFGIKAPSQSPGVAIPMPTTPSASNTPVSVVPGTSTPKPGSGQVAIPMTPIALGSFGGGSSIGGAVGVNFTQISGQAVFDPTKNKAQPVLTTPKPISVVQGPTVNLGIASLKPIPQINVPVLDPNSPHPSNTPDTASTQDLGGVQSAIGAVSDVPGVNAITGGTLGIANAAVGVLGTTLNVLASLTAGQDPYTEAQLNYISGDPLKAAAVLGGQVAVEGLINGAANKIQTQQLENDKNAGVVARVSTTPDPSSVFNDATVPPLGVNLHSGFVGTSAVAGSSSTNSSVLAAKTVTPSAIPVSTPVTLMSSTLRQATIAPVVPAKVVPPTVTPSNTFVKAPVVVPAALAPKPTAVLTVPAPSPAKAVVPVQPAPVKLPTATVPTPIKTTAPIVKSAVVAPARIVGPFERN